MPLLHQLQTEGLDERTLTDSRRAGDAHAYPLARIGDQLFEDRLPQRRLLGTRTFD